MALINIKPTSPGRRGMVKVVDDSLYKGRPVRSLLEKLSKTGGRNHNGHITTRHHGGGHKKHYRLIDFKRDKDSMPAKIERIEYDPCRTAYIALLCYADGERRYIVATEGLSVGQFVESGSEAAVKAGNALFIRNIPVGSTICCVEMLPGKGAQLARAAGSAAQLVAREGKHAQIKLRSGEVRLIHSDCRAVIGRVCNAENSLRKKGKAGANRWRGIRPTVRGVAMNPIDHPHGGGEGKTAAGRHPVSPWGTPTKGYRTRRNKRTSSMIIQRRNKK